MNKPDPKDYPPESPHDLEWGGVSQKYYSDMIKWNEYHRATAINWNKIKFRASSWGNLLTGTKTDKDAIGETCKKELIKIYNQEVYGRKKDIVTKQMDKGIQCEPEAIALFSMLEGKFFYKNDQQLENDWFTGHPDVHDGDSIYVAKEVDDMKCSWDLDTFMPKLMEEPDKAYVAQLNVYYDLTGAQQGHLVYCLISAPQHIINQEKEQLFYRMCKNTDRIVSEFSPDYIKAVKELERLMIFDDIPPQERCIKIPVPRDEELIEKMKAKAPRLREWLHDFHKKHKSLYKQEVTN